MPRFNDQEKQDLAEVLSDIEQQLGEAVEFADKNGPVAIANKLDRAYVLISDVLEKLGAK